VAKKEWNADKWTFSVEEVSPGVYEAVADDHQGDSIRKVRSDEAEALDLLKQEVAQITERRRQGAQP